MEELKPSINEQDTNSVIETLLDQRMAAIEDVLVADVLTYLGPIAPGLDEQIKTAVEEISNRRARLAVLLETPGGYIETAERIASIFRHHYQHVDFIVPSFAMSAGTVLVMSGDAVFMDYASVLGPIDPQIRRGGEFVPALGYLEQYDRLIQKSRDGKLTTAELTYLVQRFDPAELYRYEQERELSIALLKDWLVNYKFKNWTKTATRGKKVTKRMRSSRAGQIARLLNKTDRWHSHSRGIPMEVLRREFKLQIDDFGEDAPLASCIRDYFRLLKDYSDRRGHEFAVLHTKGNYLGV